MSVMVRAADGVRNLWVLRNSDFKCVCDEGDRYAVIVEGDVSSPAAFETAGDMHFIPKEAVSRVVMSP